MRIRKWRSFDGRTGRQNMVQKARSLAPPGPVMFPPSSAAIAVPPKRRTPKAESAAFFRSMRVRRCGDARECYAAEVTVVAAEQRAATDKAFGRGGRRAMPTLHVAMTCPAGRHAANHPVAGCRLNAFADSCGWETRLKQLIRVYNARHERGNVPIFRFCPNQQTHVAAIDAIIVAGRMPRRAAQLRQSPWRRSCCKAKRRARALGHIFASENFTLRTPPSPRSALPN